MEFSSPHEWVASQKKGMTSSESWIRVCRILVCSLHQLLGISNRDILGLFEPEIFRVFIDN